MDLCLKVQKITKYIGIFRLDVLQSVSCQDSSWLTKESQHVDRRDQYRYTDLSGVRRQVCGNDLQELRSEETGLRMEKGISPKNVSHPDMQYQDDRMQAVFHQSL